MKTKPFTRPTMIAAVEVLGSVLSQARFDQLIVRLELNNEAALGPARSVTAKSAQVAHIATQRATQVVATLEGPMTLAEALVRSAVDTLLPSHGHAEQKP